MDKREQLQQIINLTSHHDTEKLSWEALNDFLMHLDQLNTFEENEFDSPFIKSVKIVKKYTMTNFNASIFSASNIVRWLIVESLLVLKNLKFEKFKLNLITDEDVHQLMDMMDEEFTWQEILFGMSEEDHSVFKLLRSFDMDEIKKRMQVIEFKNLKIEFKNEIKEKKDKKEKKKINKDVQNVQEKIKNIKKDKKSKIEKQKNHKKSFKEKNNKNYRK